MRKLISVIFNLFLTSSVVAQTCPDQNLFYTTQEEVDNFPVQYPDCTDLTHDFALFGANITDLSPLGKIKNVSTFLSLTELEGDIGISEFLNQFDTIGLTLFIEGIRSSESIVVEDLDYLGGLVFRNSRFVETFSVSTDSMGESFFISLENNRELLNLSFTASQDTLKAEEVRVLDNEMLTTLTLLGDVRTVTGDLLIEDSSDLDRITGLETLESVGGILSSST